jgi:maltose-binding protein MalE
MKKLLAIAFAAVFATSALAQQAVGPNGGSLAGKAGHETELVISPTELTVYLIDKGKAHSTKGASLRAVVQEGGKSTTVPLVDVKNEKLVGKLAAPLGKGAIVVITGKDDHGDAVSARYTVN